MRGSCRQPRVFHGKIVIFEHVERQPNVRFMPHRQFSAYRSRRVITCSRGSRFLQSFASPL